VKPVGSADNFFKINNKLLFIINPTLTTQRSRSDGLLGRITSWLELQSAVP
jgi:hypothetical protein